MTPDQWFYLAVILFCILLVVVAYWAIAVASQDRKK